MKVVIGLGNPGPEYEDTRHNVGWWAVDRLCRDWGLGPFRRKGDSLVAEGPVAGTAVRILKPLTYMNRSGLTLARFRSRPEFDISSDLLIVVDDAALEVGHIRFRARGSAGGHRGLESVEQALGTRAYARLRIGVGRPPPGIDLVDWVLSAPDADEEAAIVALLPRVSEAIGVWVQHGIEEAMNRYNR